MSIALSKLDGREVSGLDGPLGRLDDIYFDDRTWRIRWLVVRAGSWRHHKDVLLAPEEITPAGEGLRARFANTDIASHPDADAHPPISARMNEEFRDYVRWAAYWVSGFYAPIWHDHEVSVAIAPEERRPNDDALHLRSARAVLGHHVMTPQGLCGHISDFMVDTGAWAVERLEITEGVWPMAHTSLVSSYWVHAVSWARATVDLDLPRERVRHAAAAEQRP